jgi:hypothetical protein
MGGVCAHAQKGGAIEGPGAAAGVAAGAGWIVRGSRVRRSKALRMARLRCAWLEVAYGDRRGGGRTAASAAKVAIEECQGVRSEM